MPDTPTPHDPSRRPRGSRPCPRCGGPHVLSWCGPSDPGHPGDCGADCGDHCLTCEPAALDRGLALLPEPAGLATALARVLRDLLAATRTEAEGLCAEVATLCAERRDAIATHAQEVEALHEDLARSAALLHRARRAATEAEAEDIADGLRRELAEAEETTARLRHEVDEAHEDAADLRRELGVATPTEGGTPR
jgi:hypothetical protein